MLLLPAVLLGVLQAGEAAHAATPVVPEPVAAVTAPPTQVAPAPSLASAPGPGAPADASLLGLDRVAARTAPSGTPPQRPAWSPDSQTLAFLWNDQGGRALDVWCVDREGRRLRRLTRAGVDGWPGASEAAWLPDGRALLVLSGGAVVRIPADGGARSVLVPGPAERTRLAVSPDGRRAAWLQGGDVWLLALDGGAAGPVQATHVAVPSIARVGSGQYARPDVEIGDGVWAEELPLRWSPDSRVLAVPHVDRRKVRRFPLPVYTAPEAFLDEVRRPAPGDENEARTVGLLDVERRTLRLLALPDPTRFALVQVAWSPRGALLVDRASDDCVERVVAVMEPGAETPREVYRDRRESRIYTPFASAWHPDGRRIVLTADLDAHDRLWLLTPGEARPRRLTSDEGDVEGAAIAAPGALVFVSSAPKPEERHVWRIGAEGGRPERLSPLAGWNRPVVAPDGSVALLHSDDANPTELWVGGTRVTHSPPPEFDRIAWARVRYFTVPGTTAGGDLHARIFEPRDLDRTRRHPVLFGPVYVNTVRNRWDPRWGPLVHHLVQRGWLVVQVDSRGSTGYGRAFREKFLFQWGSGDLDDYADVVRALSARPEIDASRMGIFGSSYGGLVTVHALLRRPGLFQAGVACAPATDPRYYGSDDVAITRTPATHPDVFARGRAAEYAAGLRDHLLLVHGMADDIVPFQTTVQLAQALVSAHKDFDVAFTPAATHFWTAREDDARYLLGKLVQHFERWVPPGPR